MFFFVLDAFFLHKIELKSTIQSSAGTINGSCMKYVKLQSFNFQSIEYLQIGVGILCKK